MTTPDPNAPPADGGNAPPPPAPPADGGGAKPWYDSYGLDDEARAFIAGKGSQTPADGIKSWMHADKIARERNVLEAPDVNNIQGWKGWEALGWTPDAAKYDVPLPETAKDLGDLAEGYKGFHDHLVKQLHARRVPLSAARELAGELVAFNVAGIREADAAIAREKQELEGGLRREWGQAYDANREMAKRAMQHFKVGEATAGQLDAMMGSAEMVRLFQEIGAALGEDRLVTVKGGSSQGVDQARAAKAALEADPAKRAALFDTSHAQHALVKAERQRLMDIINAEKR